MQETREPTQPPNWTARTAFTDPVFLKDPAIAQPLTMFYYFKSRYDWIDGQQQPSRELALDPAALRAELLRYRFVIVECNVTWVRDIGFGFPAAVLAAFGQPVDRALPPLPEDKFQSLMGVMAGHRLPH